jgi:hypothetical protein
MKNELKTLEWNASIIPTELARLQPSGEQTAIPVSNIIIFCSDPAIDISLDSEIWDEPLLE